MFNLASKYHFVLKDNQINTLLMLIEEYVNGAELQIGRINRTRRSIKKTLTERGENKNINWTTSRNQHLKLFCDAHFYFICIGQVNRCLGRLCKIMNNKNLGDIYLEFKKSFSREIRDDLEHIDERAIGLKKRGRKTISIGHIQDFRNFSSGSLTFNGKAYPVNKESLNRLKQFYKKTISVIHEDYALKDAFFVYDMMREKELKDAMRRAQKEYQEHQHSKEIANVST